MEPQSRARGHSVRDGRRGRGRQQRGAGQAPPSLGQACTLQGAQHRIILNALPKSEKYQIDKKSITEIMYYKSKVTENTPEQTSSRTK